MTAATTMTAEGSESRPGAIPDGGLSEAHVLLVSPCAETCGQVADRLRTAGCSVQVSRHAAAGLRRMSVAVESGTPFDVIIAD